MRFAITTMRVDVERRYGEVRDGIDQRWYRWFEHLELVPVLAPNDPISIKALFDRVRPDLVVLTGGNDVEKTSEQSTSYAQRRNVVEGVLLQSAVQAGIPVFGVCRGMQMVYKFWGGQHLNPVVSINGQANSHIGTTHPIRFETPFDSILNATEISVNSYHSFGIPLGALPGELSAAATSVDGLVEALHHRDLPIFAVQWHPERGEPSADAVSATILDQLLRNGAFWRGEV
jgi:putative glutamine amidotransferase